MDFCWIESVRSHMRLRSRRSVQSTLQPEANIIGISNVSSWIITCEGPWLHLRNVRVWKSLQNFSLEWRDESMPLLSDRHISITEFGDGWFRAVGGNTGTRWVTWAGSIFIVLCNFHIYRSRSLNKENPETGNSAQRIYMFPCPHDVNW